MRATANGSGWKLIWLVPVLCFCAASALSGADWPTFAHDPQRSGWAVEETTLTPQNVSDLLLKWKVQLKNEPLSLTDLTAPVVADHVKTSQGMKTLVYVGQCRGELAAIDSATGRIIWTRDLEIHVLPKDESMWLCPNNLNATPVIDKRTGTIYTIAPDGRLWGLDLGNGGIKFGPAQFVPPFSKNWSLNLHDSTIYTSISQGCGGAPSGIYSMDVHDPRRPVVRALVVAKNGGGIWGRGGPVIGLNGLIYGVTGDGKFAPSDGDYGSSFIAASLRDLKVIDYFAPINFQHVTDYDLDMAASSPIWFSSGNRNLLAGGGKEGVLYLLDADSLGQKDHHTPLFTIKLANDDNAFQGEGIWGAPATWREDAGGSWLYVPIYGPASANAPKFGATNGAAPHGCIMAFRVEIDSGTQEPTLQPAWISGDLDLPDPPAVANGVVFVLSTGENPMQTTGGKVIFTHQKILTNQQREADTHNAVLYALDARTGKTLYQSGKTMGAWTHFSGLAVADGQVYAVDHDSYLYCFGLNK